MPTKPTKKEVKANFEKEIQSFVDSLHSILANTFPLAYKFSLQKKAIVSISKKLGVVAGTCDSKGNIEVNEAIFKRYPHLWKEVIAHEFAHHVTNLMCHKTMGHSPEWERVVKALGYAPKAEHSMDLSDLRTKEQKIFIYKCFCTTHKVSIEKHKEIKSSGARCIYCEHPVKISA